MEKQNRPDRTLNPVSAAPRRGGKEANPSPVQWVADFFQITPEGMELVQKRGAESLTL